MLGIIGGTGFGSMSGAEFVEQLWPSTPFGETSGPVVISALNGLKFAFMARHGNPHRIPPHLINYRANLFAMKQAGVDRIIAINAVGGIHEKLGPGNLSIPDQIIDYTYGREHTIYDGIHCETVDHIDFTKPYSETLRAKLLRSASAVSFDVLDGGVYGATQGPRLESSAEILRCKAEGCDMVGMTGMPEAALARELELDYACIALSANWAAGLSDTPITMADIKEAVSKASARVSELIFQDLGSL